MDIMDNILYSYQNGNTTVTILQDGTKIREYENTPIIEHPESMDIKITNYCDLGCKYCHENSTIEGKHADLEKLKEILKVLPAGVELAIGGGNPLSHPELKSFLSWCKTKGFIPNLTVNQQHLSEYPDLILDLIFEGLVYGIGVSITSKNLYSVKSLCKITPHVVFHVIAGVNKIELLDELIQIPKCKVLILGYKTFGRGVNYHSESVENNIKDWYRKLYNYVRKCTLSFDNLAIEQLNVRRLFTDEGWDKFYMGNDFTFTMYIDAVKQEFAPTSRSGDRKSFNEISLLNYFKNGN
jgi:hypothetical protein